MGTYHLANGREVYLSRLSIAPTYAGWLEGTPERISSAILERLPDYAARILAPAYPLTVIPPERLPLPDWLYVAELESRRGARNTDPDFNSRLFVCWFMDGTDQSVDAVIESILFHLNWEQDAKDYDIMDF